MDTLRQHNSRPVRANLDLRDARLSQVMGEYSRAEKMLKDWNGDVKVSPEREALEFYLQNHAMALVAQTLDSDEPLGRFSTAVEAYHRDVGKKAIRMFYYLLLICTRESRHMTPSWAQKSQIWLKYPAIKGFWETYVEDSGAKQAVTAIMENAPDVSLGYYANFLVDAFDKDLTSVSFGGQKWHEIAVPLSQFIHGEMSAEALMDTSFALCHNGGPIFNKGMLFTNFNSKAVYKILDVQRSGQIPQLIANPPSDIESYVSTKMKDYVAEFAGALDGLSGPVDWKVVVNAHGSWAYPDEVKAQVVKELYEKSEKSLHHFKLPMKEVVLANSKKLGEQQQIKAETATAAEVLKSSIEVMSGVFVLLAERSQ